MGWDNETPREVEAAVPFFQKSILPFNEAERKLTVVNPGAGRLYMTAYAAGVPPAGAEKAHENNLRLEVAYRDMKDNVIDPELMTQGSDLKVEISITNLSKASLSNLALTHIVPTGCQIANPRLFSAPAGAPVRGYYDYQDVRDDRILTYFSLGAGAKKTFTAVLNASYSGRFYLPGINVESMYDPAFQANTTGKWVEITR